MYFPISIATLWQFHCLVVVLSMDDIDVVITNNQSYGRKPPWDVPSTKDTKFVDFTINSKPAYAINHHLCHVASSYYTSPFNSATIITQDGGGDNEVRCLC